MKFMVKYRLVPHMIYLTNKHRKKKENFSMNPKPAKTTCLLLLLLILAISFLTAACGSNDNSMPKPPDTLASKESLRASDIVLDINSKDFTPQTPASVPMNPYPDLSVPTYITKVDNLYFIVDCYHDQIIYHDNLTDPLSQWHVMTDQISKGHTLASDGLIYLADDTENNRILIFEKKDGVFYHTQTFEEIGNRPHYIIYDDNTQTFYALSSMSGEMYLFRHDPGDSRMHLTKTYWIEQLAGTYVRSFTISGNDIYFVSGVLGNPAILRADLGTFEIRETYPVPDSMAGMIQLTITENDYYITISTDINGNQDYATMIHTDDLSHLIEGKYDDVYQHFIGGGTPYYVTFIDNNYYLTEHRIPGHSIWEFKITGDSIHDVKTIY